MTASPPQQDATQDAVRAAMVTLQRRFDRERAARKSAETLLNDKSRALWDALQLARESERRLNLALWATGEGIWVWDKPAQRVQVTGLTVAGLASKLDGGTMTEVFDRIHPEDLPALRSTAARHDSGELAQIEVEFRMQDRKSVV